MRKGAKTYRVTLEVFVVVNPDKPTVQNAESAGAAVRSYIRSVSPTEKSPTHGGYYFRSDLIEVVGSQEMLGA